MEKILYVWLKGRKKQMNDDMDNISASSVNELFLQNGGDFLFLFYEETNKHGEIQVLGIVIVVIIALPKLEQKQEVVYLLILSGAKNESHFMFIE